MHWGLVRHGLSVLHVAPSVQSHAAVSCRFFHLQCKSSIAGARSQVWTLSSWLTWSCNFSPPMSEEHPEALSAGTPKCINPFNWVISAALLFLPAAGYVERSTIYEQKTPTWSLFNWFDSVSGHAYACATLLGAPFRPTHVVVPSFICTRVGLLLASDHWAKVSQVMNWKCEAAKSYCTTCRHFGKNWSLMTLFGLCIPSNYLARTSWHACSATVSQPVNLSKDCIEMD